MSHFSATASPRRSHFYTDKNNQKVQYPFQTSWGVDDARVGSAAS